MILTGRAILSRMLPEDFLPGIERNSIEIDPFDREDLADIGMYLTSPEDIYVEPGSSCRILVKSRLTVPDSLAGFVTELSHLRFSGIYVHAEMMPPQYDGELTVVINNTSDRLFPIHEGEPLAVLQFSTLCHY